MPARRRADAHQSLRGAKDRARVPDRDNDFIAGIVRIAQDSAQSISGFIEAIDYANGTLIINGQRISSGHFRLEV